jgi:hypothetical protein
MARLYLFAEGQTEQTFADTLLKPHLADFSVYMHNPVLIAHARKKGRVHRGGGRNFQAMQNDIVRFLRQESGSGVYFTTMIDLYALHNGFPDADEAEKLRNDPYKRVEALESSWANMTSDRRFIPFIQLHEYETYLFADAAQLEFFYENAQSSIATLRQIADRVASPELINDGQQTAPSKRIIAEFPAYERAKTIVGPQIAELIGLKTIRTQCPHFDAWLKRLESLE